MKIDKWFYWIAGALVACVAIAGGRSEAAGKRDGAKTAQPASPPSELIWPLPPDLPRVRWLAEYTDLARVKNPGSAKKGGWMEKVTGKKTVNLKQMLRKPYAVTTDTWGRIYVSDAELKAVFIIDPDARTVERREGTSQAPMGMPTGLDVDSANRLFVADAQLHSITCYDPSGELVARFGADSLGRPGGIAIDRQRNRLYVADAKESHIAVFDTKKFALIGYFGAPSKPPNSEKGTFSGPTNIALDRHGNIYVADTLNCRVQILNPAGKFVRMFGTQGDRPGEFIRPKGIAVDSEGHVYVADAEFNNFQVLSPEGQPLLAVGVIGSAPGEFTLIAGLHIDSRDRIYTTEMFVGRVQVFQYISQPDSQEGKEVVKASEH